MASHVSVMLSKKDIKHPKNTLMTTKATTTIITCPANIIDLSKANDL
jgi:hypothetical protein